MVRPVQIVPYDPGWVEEFRAQRERMALALGKIALRIEHNGSTAVPGLAAKPIIDVQISVAQLQPLVAYAAPLARLGYVHLQHADDAFCPFFYRPAAWPHSHHVHVVEYGAQEERRTLAFRDFLREHSDVAQEYAAVKQRLAAGADEADASAREAYATAKGEFVNRVVQAALEAGYPRGL